MYADGSLSNGQVELVWNKGIAALCDRRFPDEFPDGTNYVQAPRFAGALASRWLPDDLIAPSDSHGEIREGEVVWVRLSWLKSFEKQVLPFVKDTLTLVTADSDSCVPSDLGTLGERVLRSGKVKHWYTQNYDGSGPLNRVSPLPIGIDFHMLSEKPLWGEEISSPLEQEQILLTVRRSLPPLLERQPKVYVDFGWQGGGVRRFLDYQRLRGTRLREGRSAIAGKLKKNAIIHFQTGPLPRTEMWRTRGQYAFVLSPHGKGLDCHRTWEALALGHIVLVPSSSLNSLFTDLPVIPLENWSDINPTNLERWLSLCHGKDSVPERLKSRYWVNAMRAKVKEAGA